MHNYRGFKVCLNGTEILFNLKRARDLFKERQEGVKWNYFAICQQSSPHHTPTHSFVGVTVSVGEVFSCEGEEICEYGY